MGYTDLAQHWHGEMAK